MRFPKLSAGGADDNRQARCTPSVRRPRCFDTTIRRGLLGVLGLLGSALAACGGGAEQVPEVAPDLVEAVRTPLLQPYRKERQVLCDHMVLEVTANFLQDLSQPGHDPSLHQFTQDDKEGMTEYRWLNPRGEEGSPFRFFVQQTEVVVVYSARLRILTGTRPMTLDLKAQGDCAIYHKAEDRFEMPLESIEVNASGWQVTPAKDG